MTDMKRGYNPPPEGPRPPTPPPPPPPPPTAVNPLVINNVVMLGTVWVLVRCDTGRPLMSGYNNEPEFRGVFYSEVQARMTGEKELAEFEGWMNLSWSIWKIFPCTLDQVVSRDIIEKQGVEVGRWEYRLVEVPKKR